MKFQAIGAGLALLWFVSAAHAGNWTSPDGKIGFDLPTDGSLVAVKNPPPPAIAMWTTADGAARLMFLVQPNPQNLPLDRAGLEEGTLGQFPGGSLLSSTETSINGVPAFTIAVTNNQKLFLQQCVVAFNGTAYKVMAAGPTQISSDARLQRAFQSLAVLDPNPLVPGRKISAHDMSVKVGEIGVFVLIGAAVVAVLRSSRRKNV